MDLAGLSVSANRKNASATDFILRSATDEGERHRQFARQNNRYSRWKVIYCCKKYRSVPVVASYRLPARRNNFSHKRRQAMPALALLLRTDGYGQSSKRPCRKWHSSSVCRRIVRLDRLATRSERVHLACSVRTRFCRPTKND